MLLEIVSPYDAEGCCDCHESWQSFFSRLVELCEADDSVREGLEEGEDGFGQTELSVYRWDSWEDREAGLEAGREPVIWDVDNLIYHTPQECGA